VFDPDFAGVLLRKSRAVGPLAECWSRIAVSFRSASSRDAHHPPASYDRGRTYFVSTYQPLRGYHGAVSRGRGGGGEAAFPPPPPVIVTSSKFCSLRMQQHLLIEIIRHLPRKLQRDLHSLLRPQRLEIRLRARTPQQLIPRQHKLRNDTQQIEMGAVREQEIPQDQHFGQRRRARAHGQHAGESVDLGFHAFGQEVVCKLRVEEFEQAVDEGQALVHAVHAAADVAGDFDGDEAVEAGESLGLAAGGVEEGRGHDVHALDVADAGDGVGGRVDVAGI
jgi:hypothetical protein